MRAWLAGLVLILAGCAHRGEVSGVRSFDLAPEEETLAEALAGYGRGLLEAGDEEAPDPGARAWFERAAAAAPDAHRVQSRLALQALLAGETDEAVDILERSVEKNPDLLVARVDLARAYHAAERAEDCIREYRAAIRLAPTNTALYAATARLQFLSERDDEALRTIARGLARADQPTYLEELCRNQGREFIVSSQPRRAIPCFEFLLEHAPDRFQHYDYLLGELYRQSGDMKTAQRYYRQATRREDPLPEAFVKLAGLLGAEDPEAAIAALERGAELLPENAVIRLTLAYFYRYRARHADAVEQYAVVDELAEERPDINLQATFFLNYGSACEQAGRHERAVEIFERGIAEYPRDAQLLNYLAYMWAEGGENLERAERYIAVALEEEPENGAYLDTLGWIYYRQGRYEEALRELLRAAQRMPGDPTITAHVGDAYFARGNVERAVKYWTESFLLDPAAADVAAKLREQKADLKALRKRARAERERRKAEKATREAAPEDDSEEE